jgi:hypothetical protein
VPATHARLAANQGLLDVWRDRHGRVAFHWVDDGGGEGFRYEPSRHVFAQLAGGQVLFSTTYLSSRMGWRAIRSLYGVRESAVMAALASGGLSREPADYAVAAPPQKKDAGGYDGFTDYGTDLAGLAKDTSLVLPRLTVLDGQPLMDASYGPQGPAGVAFGPDPLGDPVIDIQVTTHRPKSHSAREFVFAYRDGEWISVTPKHTLSQSRQAELVRAIRTAPTVG